jgi:signal recognition particle receptor subunit beta
VDYFERRGTPFIVAVNCFENAPKYDLAEVELALNLGSHVPVMLCDVRQRESCKDVLIRLVQHAMKSRGVRAKPAVETSAP